MNGRLGFRRANKRTRFINSYKGQVIVESQDRQCPEWIWHIEDVE